MKKIKLKNKLSLNKENISVLNSAEQTNAIGGRKPATISPCGIVCVSFNGECGTGCVCTNSQVKTCGIYCPPDDVIK